MYDINNVERVDPIIIKGPTNHDPKVPPGVLEQVLIALRDKYQDYPEPGEDRDIENKWLGRAFAKPVAKELYEGYKPDSEYPFNTPLKNEYDEEVTYVPEALSRVTGFESETSFVNNKLLIDLNGRGDDVSFDMTKPMAEGAVVVLEKYPWVYPFDPDQAYSKAKFHFERTRVVCGPLEPNTIYRNFATTIGKEGCYPVSVRGYDIKQVTRNGDVDTHDGIVFGFLSDSSWRREETVHIGYEIYNASNEVRTFAIIFYTLWIECDSEYLLGIVTKYHTMLNGSGNPLKIALNDENESRVTVSGSSELPAWPVGITEYSLSFVSGPDNHKNNGYPIVSGVYVEEDTPEYTSGTVTAIINYPYGEQTGFEDVTYHMDVRIFWAYGPLPFFRYGFNAINNSDWDSDWNTIAANTSIDFVIEHTIIRNTSYVHSPYQRSSLPEHFIPLSMGGFNISALGSTVDDGLVLERLYFETAPGEVDKFRLKGTIRNVTNEDQTIAYFSVYMVICSAEDVFNGRALTMEVDDYGGQHYSEDYPVYHKGNELTVDQLITDHGYMFMKHYDRYILMSEISVQECFEHELNNHAVMSFDLNI